MICTPFIISSIDTVMSSTGSGHQSKANLPPIAVMTASITSSAGTIMTTSVTSSTSSRCHLKANLPLELLADGKWQKILMPALLLWAGGSDDIWTILQAAIGYTLPLIIDLKSNLDSTGMDFSWQGLIVSVVHCCSVYLLPVIDILKQASQHLCNWWHNIGSTAVAVIISFLQCAEYD